MSVLLLFYLLIVADLSNFLFLSDYGDADNFVNDSGEFTDYYYYYYV